MWVGYTVSIFSPHTTRVKIRECILQRYGSHLEFSYFTQVNYYITPRRLFWILFYIYLCFIHTHELLVSASNLFGVIFKINVGILRHFVGLVDQYFFLNTRVEINKYRLVSIHTSLEKLFNYLLNGI